MLKILLSVLIILSICVSNDLQGWSDLDTPKSLCVMKFFPGEVVIVENEEAKIKLAGIDSLCVDWDTTESVHIKLLIDSIVSDDGITVSSSCLDGYGQYDSYLSYQKFNILFNCSDYKRGILIFKKEKYFVWFSDISSNLLHEYITDIRDNISDAR